jgi:hypothetical protein
MKLLPASCGSREKRPLAARSMESGLEVSCSAAVRAGVSGVVEGVVCGVNSGLVQ